MKKAIMVVFVIGLMVSACQNPAGGGGSSDGIPPSSVPSEGTNTSLNGTWVATGPNGSQAGFKFNNGNFEIFGIDISVPNGNFVPNGVPIVKGTYSASSSKITLTNTHIYGSSTSLGLESKWYSKADLEGLNIYLGMWESPSTLDYTLNGNKLTLTGEGGGSYTFTRQ